MVLLAVLWCSYDEFLRFVAKIFLEKSIAITGIWKQAWEFLISHK